MDVSRLARSTNQVDFDILVLIGGPPCQPFSQLANAPAGFTDPRPALTHAFVQLREALRQQVRLDKGKQFHWLLEEVASMSAEHRTEVSNILGAQLVLLNAADFGWAQHPRLFWGARHPPVSPAGLREHLFSRYRGAGSNCRPVDGPSRSHTLGA